MHHAAFQNPLVKQIADFLLDIGLPVRAETLPEPTFLPGILIARGALVIDERHLRFPGDLLHEAGHLAVAAPSRRQRFHGDIGNDPGEEMMAIAWSYAAALAIGLDPAVVFHADGYRGGSAAILDNFAQGHYIGVPLLQWVGLAAEPAQAAALGIPPYPYMRKWLRDVEDPAAHDAAVEAAV